MKNLRLVLLDYAKNHLENTDTQKTLKDVIFSKQKNFERTDPNYVVLDKHDMIGTHYLIYDVTNIHSPRLIFAIRTTFEDRAIKHRLKTPLQDLVPILPPHCLKAYEEFRDQCPTLVDCNAWFVDPAFSVKSSGLPLSDIGYTMIYSHMKRFGFQKWVGCSNERYKASRHIKKAGYFKPNLDFIHPVVTDTHRLILFEKFNEDFLKSVYTENKELFENLLEIAPHIPKELSWQETMNSLFGPPSTNLMDKRAS